jgi:hypothetical protein
MKQTRIVAGLVLALASSAALAASGERWYGTNRGIVYEPIVDPIVVERVVPAERGLFYPDRDVVYVERDVRTAPVIVERSYVDRPGYYAGVYESNLVKPLNPETGHLIENGLFNRWGPNDFGS